MPALLRWILTSVWSQKYILLRIILSVLNKSKQASCAEMVLDYCYVRRRAEYTSLGPGLEHLSLRADSSLAAKSRADALHVVLFFNKASEPSTGAAAALCVHLHDT